MTMPTCAGSRAAAAGAGQRIAQILLTHRHPDHSAGAARLAGLTGAPVLAADPELRLGGGGGLAPGDVLTGAGCEIRVVGPPGHTDDSVCLLLPADGALLTGDTVLGAGTTVIAQDGSLGDYLATLDRLRALADEARLRALLPGHGPLLADPAGTLDFYIAHRQERLAEVRAALAAGDRTPAEIVARVYADVDQSLWPFAEWSVRAQLDYLAGQDELPPGTAGACSQPAAGQPSRRPAVGPLRAAGRVDHQHGLGGQLVSSPGRRSRPAPC